MILYSCIYFAVY